MLYYITKLDKSIQWGMNALPVDLKAIKQASTIVIFLLRNTSPVAILVVVLLLCRQIRY